MKKLLTLFTALLLFGSMMVVQAVDYYVAGTMNGWDTKDDANKMSLVSGTIYSKTFTAMGAASYDFKISTYNWGQSWGGDVKDNTQSNVTLSGSGDISFTLSSTSDVTFYFDAGNTKKIYVQATPVVVPSYTFTSGTTIYYDFTEYSTTGINTYVGGTEAWYGSTSNVIAITLTGDWEVTSATKLWRSGASGWHDYYCTTLPTEGQNMIISTDGINYTWGTYGGGALPPASIKLHSNITNPSWADTEEFTLATNEETASLTLTGVTKGNYEFGVQIADSWTSNGSAFTRANNSHAVTSGSGNCTFNADRNGDYTFTWTYATNTLEIGYPAIPSQSVTFNSLASQILKGSVINLANCVTSSGIDEPTYRFYIKEKEGEYGDAINANYNFNANGEYVVKVEALEYGEPVAYDESAVVVYQSYTFTHGTTIYVDFSAMTEGSKEVNYPKVDQVGIDYDATGAGTVKAVTFTADVTWTTIADAFIKTGKAGWAALKFSVPGAGQDMAIVAADGASYTWGTYVPAPPTVEAKGDWDEWADALVFEGDETSVSVTKHLAIGDYEFKMIIGGEWRGNGHTFYRDYTGAEGITTTPGDNMTLEADVEGDYTFTWTYATNALNITFPEEPTPEYVTVKFFAPRDETNKWNNVYAFSWLKSRVFSDPFPGTDITANKEGEWYTYSVRKGANLLFTDDAGMQTNDIVDIQAAACYVSTAIDYEESPKKVTVTEQCTVDYYLAGMLQASMENWPANNPAYKLDANNQITFENLAAGTYEFKMTNGTWAWSIGGNDHLMSGDCSAIAETAGIGNVAFSIDHAQDVTITYYPETEKICLGAQTVLDPALAWNTTFASARIGAENTLPWLNHTLTAGVVYTSSNPSVASFADENTYELTIHAAGKTTITANYYGNEASYKLDVYDFAVPAKSIETIGGKFIINAKGDTAVFSRGNLQYDYGQNQWYCAEKQYEVLAETNLHFGDPNYNGVIDLFSWSNAVSNYGRLASNKDADFPGTDDFVDWGNVFAGDEKEWSTLSKDEWNYLMAHNNWTMIQLNQNLVSTWENGFLCMVLFPIDWEAPAELASLNYKFYDFDNEEKAAQNTFTIVQWESLFEAYGAVLLPPAGARAGCVGNTWNGDAEATKGWNADAGGWYDHVDNVGWYGYYWTGTQDTRAAYQHCASYLILPGWSEGPTLADEDDLYMPPQVWSREKRRGNSVRLVTRIPKRYTVTYAAGGAEGDVPTDTKKYLPNDNVVLAGQGALAKDGFTFAGWNDGNATYEAGAGYTMPEQDVIFTAQWDEIVPSYVEVRSGLEADRYYTICLEKNITDFKGATFWNMTYKDQDEATIVYIVEETAPEAGKPYIIQATNDNEGKLEVIYGDEVAATPVENGALRGTFENINADDFAALEGTVYLLINNAIRPRTTGNYLSAHRAYIRYDLLTVPQTQNFAPGRRVKSMPLQPKVATGMEQAEISDKPAKAIIEGQLFILRGEKMYDATGRQVK